jgi:cyclophilin family peptidyl-prolyl cis-trans isomerase
MQANMPVRLPPSLLPRLAIGLSLALLAGCSSSNPADAKSAAGPHSSGGLHATLVTDKGPIEVALLGTDSPKAVENFRLLSERGYYNGVVFHRVIKGFMIQGGDPKGDGTGGDSAWGGPFADDILRDSALYRHGYVRGMVAMANAGPDTNRSQFFIMHEDYPLPPNYVVFGRVTKGMDVVDAIASTPTKMGPGGEMSMPVKPPVILKVTISP